MPRNHRIVINPAKFFTTVTIVVTNPKHNIISGNTLFGPYFFPRMPRNGAVKTYGTKNTLRMILYWFPWRFKLESRPAVLAFPRFDLSRLLKRYMAARTGRIRVSSFHTSFLSAIGSRM
jgi:hypothetical protein